MLSDDSILDEIIYARVLITLQRMKLDEQDRKLRGHLDEIIGSSAEDTERCQDSLKRAWVRASASLSQEPAANDIAA